MKTNKGSEDIQPGDRVGRCVVPKTKPPNGVSHSHVGNKVPSTSCWSLLVSRLFSRQLKAPKQPSVTFTAPSKLHISPVTHYPPPQHSFKMADGGSYPATSGWVSDHKAHVICSKPCFPAVLRASCLKRCFFLGWAASSRRGTLPYSSRGPTFRTWFCINPYDPYNHYSIFMV